MRIGIIGGGPAGIFAALEASKYYSDISLFDKNDFLGRKLSTTGGGRCNLTNVNISPSKYHSIGQFRFNRLIGFYNYDFIQKYLSNLGIFTHHTDDGWVYPISNSAKNVSNFLEILLRISRIKILKDTTVIDFKKVDNSFALITDDGRNFQFDKLIIATGGKAHPQLNASDDILQSLKKFGHELHPAFPALSPIRTTKNETKKLNGVRTDSTIRIYDKNQPIGNDFGNVIFSEYGINGPGVMNLSYLVHQNKNLTLEIDFSSQIPQDFFSIISPKIERIEDFSTYLLNILNKKIIDVLIENHKLEINQSLGKNGNKNLFNHLKLKEKILGTRGFEFAQISTGAIKSEDVHPETLESTLCPGLFFAGEVLDVFGPCGGYNLHWAFISGIVAGKLSS